MNTKEIGSTLARALRYLNAVPRQERDQVFARAKVDITAAGGDQALALKDLDTLAAAHGFAGA